MNIKKYFWGLNPQALKEIAKIIKDPEHPKYVERIFVLLSRCDSPKELFALVGKERFVRAWPKIRQYWIKKKQSPDFRAWWETVYEQLSGKTRPLGRSSENLIKLGKILKDKRIRLGWSQSDLARRAGMKQPDISDIELGTKNITLGTLMRLSKILGIDSWSWGNE
ncbi:helix-turn-helix transcriptional regulator [Candidatus Saganbacteria bacterium]|nr:helix-turn-helix transcriptional regulator [Candidatus Saganbacteria bacterium]